MNEPITIFHDKEGARLSRWAIKAGMLITDVNYDARSGCLDVTVEEPTKTEAGDRRHHRSRWRVMTFHGSIHMATIPARDEADAREIAANSNYRAEVLRREVGPWERV